MGNGFLSRIIKNRLFTYDKFFFMKVSTSILFFLFVVLNNTAIAQKKFACFQNDKKSSLKISVCFKNDRASYVKYYGQDETIPVFYKSSHSYMEKGAAHGYWSSVYIEKYRGKVTGRYTITNAGIGGLDLTYIRYKDNKKFYFKLISNKSDYSIYQSNPCF